jgi:AraC-like DNA-binding protein
VPLSKGVLRPERLARTATFDEVEPTPETAYWIERIWSVQWDLDQEVVTSTVPHPAISVTVERGGGARDGRSGDGVWVTGVVSKRFDVTQIGTGGAVGIKFHPGGFTALTRIAAGSLTDRVVRAGELVRAFDALAGLPLDARSAREDLCSCVAGLGATADGLYDDVAEVLRILRDPDVTRVDDLGVRSGLSPRTLQRLFQRYVGVSPKWVLRRYRLHDAMTALDDGYTGSLADLATGLGWYDQSQFARDFTSLVGTPPSTYRDRPRPDASKSSPRAHRSSPRARGSGEGG